MARRVMMASLYHERVTAPCVATKDETPPSSPGSGGSGGAPPATPTAPFTPDAGARRAGGDWEVRDDCCAPLYK